MPTASAQPAGPIRLPAPQATSLTEGKDHRRPLMRSARRAPMLPVVSAQLTSCYDAPDLTGRVRDRKARISKMPGGVEPASSNIAEQRSLPCWQCCVARRGAAAPSLGTGHRSAAATRAKSTVKAAGGAACVDHLRE